MFLFFAGQFIQKARHFPYICTLHWQHTGLRSNGFGTRTEHPGCCNAYPMLAEYDFTLPAGHTATWNCEAPHRPGSSRYTAQAAAACRPSGHTLHIQGIRQCSILVATLIHLHSPANNPTPGEEPRTQQTHMHMRGDVTDAHDQRAAANARCVSTHLACTISGNWDMQSHCCHAWLYTCCVQS